MVSKHKAYKNRVNNRKGYTLIQMVVVMVIIAILLGLTTFGISAIAKQSYMTEVNDAAKSIFMAFQSALTRIKSEGLADEVFNEKYRAEDISKIKDGEYYYVSVPDEVVRGYTTGDDVNVPGVVDSNGNKPSVEELDKIAKNLVYIRLNRTGSDRLAGVHGNSSEQLLLDIVDSYIVDKDILHGYDVLVEFNINTMTVRAVFATRKSSQKLSYYYDEDLKLFPNSGVALEAKHNVLIRSAGRLKNKDQGYYGFGSAGYDETILKLQRPQLTIYNDDILAVEWLEPGNLSGSALNKDALVNLKYKLKIVNSVDTSKVYYEIADISAYDSAHNEYGANYSHASPPIARYDIFKPGETAESLKDQNLTKSFKVKELQEGALVEVPNKELRLSYVDASSTSQGIYRLILDMIDEDTGSNSLSVRNNFPAIPIDENFKVVVEVTHKGEGFVSADEMTSGDTNVLFSSRVFSKFYKDGKPSDTSNLNQKENVWFEITHARHLNNVRYVTGENNYVTDANKENEARKFILRSDVDWSVQKLGYNTITKNHKLITANTADYANALTDAQADSKLRYFAPIDTGNLFGSELDSNATNLVVSGFKGVIKSDYDSSVLLPSGSYEQNKHSVSYLRISELNKDGAGKLVADKTADNVGLFSIVEEEAAASSITFNGASVTGNQNVGVFAGVFKGVASDISVNINGSSVDIGTLTTIKKINPFKITNANSARVMNSNSLNVGGLFGLVTSSGNHTTKLTNVYNGIVTDDEGIASAGISVVSSNAVAGGVIGQSTTSSNQSNIEIVNAKNGGKVTADFDIAGGIVGRVNNAGHNITIDNSENFADVISQKNYAGGIAGSIVDESISGTATTVFTLNSNHGVIRAGWDYAGGLAGYVENKNSLIDIKVGDNFADVSAKNYAGGAFGKILNTSNAKVLRIDSVSNSGKITTSIDYAGGIAGYSENQGKTIDVKGLVNDVKGKVAASKYAGGAFGYVINGKNSEIIVYDVDNKAVVNAGDNFAGGAFAYILNDEKAGLFSVNKVENNGAVTAANDFAGGIIASSLNKSDNVNYLDFVNHENATVTAKNYAGGVVGKSENTHGVVSYEQMTNKANVKSTTDYAGGIGGSVVNTDNKDAKTKFDTIINDENAFVNSVGDFAGGIIGSSNYLKDGTAGSVELSDIINSGNVQSNKDFAGGIFGLVGNNTSLVNGRNKADLILSRNKFAGGIAGISVNEVNMTTVFNSGTLVKAEKDYAGGIVAFVSSEARMFGDAVSSSKDVQKTSISNAKTDYVNVDGKEYTNTSNVFALGDYAGGIVGFVDNAGVVDTFKNLTNGKAASGSVFVGATTFTGVKSSNYAGGIVGRSDSDKSDIFTYDNDMLENWIINSSSKYTNIADVSAGYTLNGVKQGGNYAGGIAGSSNSDLINVFNGSNNVVAETKFAGGIAGEMSAKDGDVISVKYNNAIVLDKMFDLTKSGTFTPTNKANVTVNGARTNVSGVYNPDGYAGGIVGSMVNGVVENAFNGGNVASKGINAGGIVGYGKDIKITTGTVSTNDYAIKMITSNSLFTNNGDISAAIANSGGIAGKIESEKVTSNYNDFKGSVISNVVNAGGNNKLVSASSGIANEGGVNAGGIAGYAKNTKIGYTNAFYPKQMIAGGEVFTNMANVQVAGSLGISGNVGGIVGNANNVHVTDVLNHGAKVTATNSNNAGGVFGKVNSDASAINSKLAFDNSVIDKMIDVAVGASSDSKADQKKIGFTNTADVLAKYGNAGGIAGLAQATDISDVFNRGDVTAGNVINQLNSTSFSRINNETDGSGNINYSVTNAGGLVGYAQNGTTIENTRKDVVRSKIIIAGVMNSFADVTAYKNSGGIVGLIEGADSDVVDVYTGSLSVRDTTSVETASAARRTLAVYQAGGVAGEVNYSQLIYDEEQVKHAIKYGRYTNSLYVNALANNAGGIIGKGVGFKTGDLYNVGKVDAGWNNAGGVFGYAANGEYANSDDVVSAMLVRKGKILTNSGTITATAYNAGGIFGYANTLNAVDGNAEGINVYNAFNNGEVLVKKSGTNGDNAGGIAGLARDIHFAYSDQIINTNGNPSGDIFIYTNVANVTANRSNAGGVFGKTTVVTTITDAFNGGYANVKAVGDNAGGFIGLSQTATNKEASVVKYSDTFIQRIKVKRDYAFSNMNNVSAGNNNAGGIVGYAENSAASDKSLRFYFKDAYNKGTINAGNDNAGGIIGQGEYVGSVYQTVVPTAYGKNRYTNAMDKTNTDYDYDSVTAGNNNAGGIGGYLKNSDIKDVFNKGSVKAKAYRSGGIIGFSVDTYLGLTNSENYDDTDPTVRPFEINRTNPYIDANGNAAYSNGEKGIYSTFDPAFNAIENRVDPYVLADDSGVKKPLGMTVNEGRVVAYKQNAGGAVGHMEGGRTERLYFLRGLVISEQNAGGVVGLADEDAVVKQVTRLDAVFVNADGSVDKTKVDNTNNIILGTNNKDLTRKFANVATSSDVLDHGSVNVGGIVGYAIGETQVVDVRNFTYVEGRQFIGGVVGATNGISPTSTEAADGVSIVLAHNMKPISGIRHTIKKQLNGSVETIVIDTEEFDGCFIGGVLGGTYGDKNGKGIFITMAKNDPLITDDFSKLESTLVLATGNSSLSKEKLTPGGNKDTAITGLQYVGGISGSGGHINSAVNTGIVYGTRVIGGISGHGYKIENAYNTSKILGKNDLLYAGVNNFSKQNSTFVGGIAGEIGHVDPKSGLQEAQYTEAFIQNSYNTGNIVQGQSIIGGIVGYSAGEVIKTYNAAYVTPTPYDGRDLVESIGGDAPPDLPNPGDDGDIEDKGTQTGGIIGIMAQNLQAHIVLKDSYNAGRITFTTNGGGLVGSLESTGNNLITTYDRIINSYYLSDDSIRYYDTYTGYNSIKFNYTIEPISFYRYGTVENPVGSISDFVKKTPAQGESGNIVGDTNPNRIPMSEYGVRTFKGMMVDGADYGSHSSGWGNAGGSTGNGDVLLKQPLNNGVSGPSKTPTVTGYNSAKAFVGSPDYETTTFKYPKTDGFIAGLDFEFLQMDVYADTNDEAALAIVNLGSYFVDTGSNTDEIKDNNQKFNFYNNARVVNSFRVWDTVVSKNLEARVDYTGVDLAKKKVDFKTEIKEGVEKETTQIDRIETGEKLKFSAELPDDINPSQIDYQIFDGHSRAYYDYKNEYFILMPALKSPVKTYSFVHERDVPVEDLAEVAFRKVMINGEPYYFFMNDETGGTSLTEVDKNGVTVPTHFGNIFNSIKVETSSQAGYITLSIEINTVEMDRNFQAAKSGYFTFEAEVFDDSVSGDLDTSSNLAPYQIVSRMFNMHFSNEELYDFHNMDALEEMKDTLLVNVSDIIVDAPLELKTNTAALGSTRLRLESDPVGKTMDSNVDSTAEHVIDVENALELRDERHLYNVNKNAGLASAGSSQKLPYIAKNLQLKDDIVMTKNVNNTGHNDLIIGKSYDHFYRFTGSFDGEGHSISGFMVDKNLYPNLNYDNNGTWDVRMSAYEYGLFYELSGGVIKNLTLKDSNFIADNVGTLAYNISNGRTLKASDPDNQFYENLGPQLTIEKGSDAKIYNCVIDTDVNIYGYNVGGYTYQTSRRFNNQDDSMDINMRQAGTYTNVEFNGKINANEEKTLLKLHADSRSAAQSKVSNSGISAGILCLANGVPNANDILYESPSNVIGYATSVVVNGAITGKDAYIYGKVSASGIVGIVRDDYKVLEPVTGLELELNQQRADIIRSVNNATVVSQQQASGISQGAKGIIYDLLSQTNVFSSYNNGTVQTPSHASGGLSSGIGHYLNIVRNSVNNGTVYGKIASGITSYGIENSKISMVSNHGFVDGWQVAGGIIAAPSRYTGKTEILKKVKVKLDNAYNTGTVVVRNNIDDKDPWDDNSYAGGIIGYAPSSEHSLDASDVSLDNITADIYNDDDPIVYKYKTHLTNCYNVGSVYFYDEEQGGERNSPERRSMNNRYLGGIIGGGMNRYSTIENSFSLSDPEVKLTEKLPVASIVFVKSDGELNVDFERESFKTLKEEIGFNYQLDAVGDVAYMGNVSTMTYAQMKNLDNYITFGDIKKGYGDDTDKVVAKWITSKDKNANNNVYPFPVIQYISDDIVSKSNYVQYGIAEDPSNAGDYIEMFPDKLDIVVNDTDLGYNIALNLELNNSFVLNEPAITMDISGVHKKTVTGTPVTFDYQLIGTLGDKDLRSEYTFKLPSGVGKNFELTVMDGEPFGGYAPKEIRKYHVIDGKLTSGGRLHDETPTKEKDLGYFLPENVVYNSANNTIKIKDEEELGYYMPINGFYTIVVRTFNAGEFVDTDYSEEVKVDSKNKVSDRFQIHFAGSDNGKLPATQSNNGALTLGTESNPFRVVDQYGVIGLTTSGIAKQATVDTFFRQSADVVVTLPFYSIFEFNGIYDGAKTSAYDKNLPVNSRNNTLKFRNKEFGFASYFRTDVDAVNTATIKNVNFDVDATTGDYLSKPGKFAEATNFDANFGLVADYMDYAVIDGVTTSGDVNIIELGATFGQQRVYKGYSEDFKALFSGVVGSARNSKVVNTKNNANIGVKVSDTFNQSTSGNIIPNYSVSNPENIHVSGIIGSSIKTDFVRGNTPVANGEVVLDGLVNNGEITAKAKTGQTPPIPNPSDPDEELPEIPYNDGSAYASGIAYKVGNGVQLTRSFNGGRINTYDGTSSGLVGILDGGSISFAYNTGKIFSYAGGTAAGLVGAGRSGSVSQAYNAGMIIALENKRAALIGDGQYINDKFVVKYTPSQLEILAPDGTVIQAQKDAVIDPALDIPREDRVSTAIPSTDVALDNVYYLKDSELFWTDSYFYERDDDGTISKDSDGNYIDKEILMGFGCVPGNTWAFKNGKDKLEYTDYKLIRGSNPVEYTGYKSEIIDPLAISYDELTDINKFMAKGFSSTTFGESSNISGSGWSGDNWFINHNAYEDKEMGGSLKDDTPKDITLDELNDDLYPFPQFNSYHHIDRGHADYPEFIGYGSEVHARPETDYVKYKTEETFQDTLNMDLGNNKGLSKVDVIIRQGLPDMVKDALGYYVVEPDLIIEIERVYLFNDAAEDAIARAGDNPAYSSIVENDKTGTGYYYRITPIHIPIKMIDGKVSNGTVGVYPAKFILSDDDGSYDSSAGRFKVVLNNDVLDKMSESDIVGERFYSGVAVQYHYDDSAADDADKTNYYSRFSPHFADAVSNDVTEAWTHGTASNPYKIDTQRNFHNIALGNKLIDKGTGANISEYLKSHYIQTSDFSLTDEKTYASADVPLISSKNRATIHHENPLWQIPIGGETGFSGVYDGKNMKISDKRTNTKDKPINMSLFDYVTGEVGQFDFVLDHANKQVHIKSDSMIVSKNSGVVKDITVKANATGFEVNAYNPVNFGIVVGKTVHDDSMVTIPKVSDIKVDINGKIVRRDSNTVIGSVVGTFDGSANVENIESNVEHYSFNGVGFAQHNQSSTTGGLFGAAVTTDTSSAVVNVESSKYTGLMNHYNSLGGNIGGIIGTADGGTLNINNSSVEGKGINFAAYNTGVQAFSVGGFVGKTDNAITNIGAGSFDAIYKINNAGNGSYGGVVGLVNNGKLNVNGVKLGKNNSTDEMRVQSSRIAARSIGSVLGSINGTINANTSNSAVSIDSVVNNMKVVLEMRVSSSSGGGSVGGVIGEAVRANVILSDVKNKASVVCEGVSSGTYGGIIGSVIDAPQVKLTKVFNDFVTDDAGNNIAKEINVNTNTNVIVGGIIGAARMTVNNSILDKMTIDMTAVENKSNLLGKSLTGNSSFGGIIGSVLGNNVAKNITVTMNEVLNTGDVDTRAYNASQVSGIVGNALNAKFIVGDKTIAGEKAQVINTGDIRVNRISANDYVYAGGFVGLGRNVDLNVKHFSNHGNIGINEAADTIFVGSKKPGAASGIANARVFAGGTFGKLEGQSAINITESFNLGNISSSIPNAIVSGFGAHADLSTAGSNVFEKNINVGKLTATYPAGMIYTFNTSAVNNTSVKYNVNMGLLVSYDYGNINSTTANLSKDITSVMSLPLGIDSLGAEYTSQGLINWNAAVQGPMPIITKFYNVSLVDADAMNNILVAESVLKSDARACAKQLSLEQIQKINEFVSLTGWEQSLVSLGTSGEDTTFKIGPKTNDPATDNYRVIWLKNNKYSYISKGIDYLTVYPDAQLAKKDNGYLVEWDYDVEAQDVLKVKGYKVILSDSVTGTVYFTYDVPAGTSPLEYVIPSSDLLTIAFRIQAGVTRNLDVTVAALWGEEMHHINSSKVPGISVIGVSELGLLNVTTGWRNQTESGSRTLGSVNSAVDDIILSAKPNNIHHAYVSIKLYIDGVDSAELPVDPLEIIDLGNYEYKVRLAGIGLSSNRNKLVITSTAYDDSSRTQVSTHYFNRALPSLNFGLSIWREQNSSFITPFKQTDRTLVAYDDIIVAPTPKFSSSSVNVFVNGVELPNNSGLFKAMLKPDVNNDGTVINKVDFVIQPADNPHAVTTETFNFVRKMPKFKKQGWQTITGSQNATTLNDGTFVVDDDIKLFAKEYATGSDTVAITLNGVNVPITSNGEYTLILTPGIDNVVAVTIDSINNTEVTPKTHTMTFRRDLPAFINTTWYEKGVASVVKQLAHGTQYTVDDDVVLDLGAGLSSSEIIVTLDGNLVTSSNNLYNLNVVPGAENKVVVTLRSSINHAAKREIIVNYDRVAPTLLNTSSWTEKYAASNTGDFTLSGPFNVINDVIMNANLKSTEHTVIYKVNGLVVSLSGDNTLALPVGVSTVEVIVCPKENPSLINTTYTVKFNREVPELEASTWNEEHSATMNSIANGTSHNVLNDIVLNPVLVAEGYEVAYKLNGTAVTLATGNVMKLPAGVSSVDVIVRSISNNAISRTYTMIFTRTLPKLTDSSTWQEVSDSNQTLFGATSNYNVEDDIIVNFDLLSEGHEAVYKLNDASEKLLVSGQPIYLAVGNNDLVITVRSKSNKEIKTDYTLNLIREIPKLSDDSGWKIGESGAMKAVENGTFDAQGSVYLKLSAGRPTTSGSYTVSGGGVAHKIDEDWVRYDLVAGDNKIVVTLVSKENASVKQVFEMTFVWKPELSDNSGWMIEDGNDVVKKLADLQGLKVHHDVSLTLAAGTPGAVVAVKLDGEVVNEVSQKYILDLAAGTHTLEVTVYANNNTGVKTTYTASFERVFPEFDELGLKTSDAGEFEAFNTDKVVDITASKISIKALAKQAGSKVTVKRIDVEGNKTELAGASGLYNIDLLTGANEFEISVAFDDNEAETLTVKLTANYHVAGFSPDSGWKVANTMEENVEFEESELPYLVEDDLEMVVKPVNEFFKTIVKLDGIEVSQDPLTGEIKLALTDDVVHKITMTAIDLNDTSNAKTVEFEVIKNPKLSKFIGWKKGAEGEVKALNEAVNESVNQEDVFLVADPASIADSEFIVKVNGKFVRLDSECKLTFVAGVNTVAVANETGTSDLSFDVTLMFSPTSFMSVGGEEVQLNSFDFDKPVVSEVTENVTLFAMPMFENSEVVVTMGKEEVSSVDGEFKLELSPGKNSVSVALQRADDSEEIKTVELVFNYVAPTIKEDSTWTIDGSTHSKNEVVNNMTYRVENDVYFDVNANSDKALVEVFVNNTPVAVTKDSPLPLAAGRNNVKIITRSADNASLVEITEIVYIKSSNASRIYSEYELQEATSNTSLASSFNADSNATSAQMTEKSSNPINGHSTAVVATENEDVSTHYYKDENALEATAAGEVFEKTQKVVEKCILHPAICQNVLWAHCSLKH